MLVFAMDLHHVMIIGLADSFTLFTPGMFPPLEDFVVMAERITSATLTVAMAFAAPHLVIGLVIYLGTGVLSRLMPAMQVFFVIMPLQIALSFFLLMVTLSTAMLMYMTYFETTLTGFFTPGR